MKIVHVLQKILYSITSNLKTNISTISTIRYYDAIPRPSLLYTSRHKNKYAQRQLQTMYTSAYKHTLSFRTSSINSAAHETSGDSYLSRSRERAFVKGWPITRIYSVQQTDISRARADERMLLCAMICLRAGGALVNVVFDKYIERIGFYGY